MDTETTEMRAEQTGVKNTEGVVLSEAALRDFREKSAWMVPRCFGGYSEDDIVCREWCSRSNNRHHRAMEIRRRLNEEAAFGFFLDSFDVRCSCENERKSAEEQLKKIQEELRRVNEARAGRDRGLLAEGSTNFRRIPVGEVRWTEDFPDLTRLWRAFLETFGTSNPYGSWYGHACGKLFDIISGGAGPEDSETIFGYVKGYVTQSTPTMSWRGTYPLRILAQQVNAGGDLELTCEICYALARDFHDTYKADGRSVTLVLYASSAKRQFRVDDVGRL